MTVTVHLDAGEAHQLTRLAELGAVVFADGPVLDLCRRLRDELAQYATAQPAVNSAKPQRNDLST